MKLSYKDTHSVEERLTRSKQMNEQYPFMVPVIVQPAVKSSLTQLQRVKYIVNESLTVNEFKTQIKNRLNLRDKDTLFFECGGQIVNDQKLMKDLYATHKDKEDYLLYVFYSEVEAFG